MTSLFFSIRSYFDRISTVALYGLVVIWTASLMIVNKEWYYLPVSFVDPAVYLGWSLNPLSYRAIYPSYPGGDLIPLIFPNAFFYWLLDPFNANLAIKFISFCLCNVSIVFLTRKLFNLPTALFCLISFSSYRYTLMAIGSDYTDGRVILYFLLAASCGLGAAMYRTTPALDSSVTRWALFFIAGLFAQMMVSTAILSVTLLPLVFGFSAVGINFNSKKQFFFLSCKRNWVLSFSVSLLPWRYFPCSMQRFMAERVSMPKTPLTNFYISWEKIAFS